MVGENEEPSVARRTIISRRKETRRRDLLTNSHRDSEEKDFSRNAAVSVEKVVFEEVRGSLGLPWGDGWTK